MKRVVLLWLVISMMLSLGCGTKEEAEKPDVAVKQDAQKSTKTPTVAPRPYPKKGWKPGEELKMERTAMVDAVTGEKIESGDIPYTYDYKGTTYFFKTEENLEAFKKDPAKYIPAPE